MKPPFDIAADMDTPVSAFRKLRAFDPAFLLESVEGGQRLGRYSFIGLGRAGSLRLENSVMTYNGERTDVPAGVAGREIVLSTLRRAISAAPKLLPEVPGLPLAGGLVGSIGYDFIRRVEPIGPARPATDGDADPEIAMVAPRSLLVFDHVSRRVALLHAGAEWERQSLRREIIRALRAGVGEPPARSGHEPPAASMSEEAYVHAVGQVQEHIRAGDVFQLVLSVRFTGAAVTEPFEVYRALRLLNPSPYMFYLELGDTQLVGSSPEALVKLQGGIATLRPIAGTRPRGGNDEIDIQTRRELLADPKEAAEHVMLVDLARNDLGRVAQAGSINVNPYRSIELYSHVMHIVSGVSGTLSGGRDAVDLLCATFPAGTVVGAPKVRAMQIIDALEPVGRGFYAGTVGYFSASGDMDQAIAIRTLRFRNGRYAYQAGAGIVADSVPIKEYQEVRHKVGALEAAMRLAEEGL